MSEIDASTRLTHSPALKELGINVVSSCIRLIGSMTAVGLEPTQLALVELESTPLDHSGKLSWLLFQNAFGFVMFLNQVKKKV